MRNAFNRLLYVLEKDQTSATENQPPWWPYDTEPYHCLTIKIERNLLTNLDDLEMYGVSLIDTTWGIAIATVYEN